MSALNVVLQRSVALVFVDAAACRPNGTAIVRFAPKLALLPSCQTVVGIRGPTEILTALAKRIHAAGLATYDDVIAEIAALLLPAFKEGFRHDVREAGWIIRLLYCLPWSVLRGIPAAQFEIFVIGWSNAKGGPAGHWIRSQNRCAVEPLPSDLIATPAPSQKAMDALGWPLPVSEKFDMRRDGIALMRAQRATWNSTPGATIGGYIQAVNVSQYHLATTILHRWPDAVGCCPQEYAP